MNSATATSYEIDDISAAVEELTEQIREKLILKQDSIGILYCQPDMEIEQLTLMLKEKLGFDIIGGTTAGAATLTNDGHHELAITLHVLTADDCFFAAAISETLTDNLESSIIDAYNEALSNLSQKNALEAAKLVFCIAPIVPNHSSDDFMQTLSDLSAELPVFGFIAADDFEFAKQRVFLNGQVYDDRMVLLMVSGNIKPIFCVKNLASSQVLSKKRVTKAHDNVICEIDDKSAYEYVQDFPFIGEESSVLWNYQFFVEMQNEADDDGVLVSRALNSYDKETGEVTSFANVPQDSYIGLMYCDGKDVQNSCKEALNVLMDKISDSEAESDYKYSTVFIASCSLRIMFLANDKNAEGNLIKDTLPQHLATSGMYAFGEIAPTSIRDGKAKNRFHNATITICAL